MTAVKSAVEPSLKVPFSGHVGVENEDESKSQNMYCLLIGWHLNLGSFLCTDMTRKQKLLSEVTLR